MGKCVRWTDEECKFLLDNYEAIVPDYCSRSLGRSYVATVMRAHMLQLKHRKNYSEHEDAVLRHAWLNGDSVLSISKRLKRSVDSICQRRKKIGLTKRSRGAVWTGEEKQFLLENYKRIGADACAAELGHTKQSVMVMASRIGATKSYVYKPL